MSPRGRAQADRFRFKNADKDYSAKHEAKSDLETYLHTCEHATICVGLVADLSQANRPSLPPSSPQRSSEVRDLPSRRRLPRHWRSWSRRTPLPTSSRRLSSE